MNSDTGLPESWLSLGLAFIGGYGDAVSFVLAKTFTGHITGSMVLGAIAVATRDWRGTSDRFLAVVCFLAGVVLSVLIARGLALYVSGSALPFTFGIEVILILAAFFALTSRGAFGIESFIVCMSLALGLQNGAFRRAGGVSVHTTYLTGMITGLITTAGESWFFKSRSSPSVPSNPQFKLLPGIWCAFVVGAGVGAAMVFKFREFALLIVALLLVAIILLDWEVSHRTSRAFR